MKTGCTVLLLSAMLLAGCGEIPKLDRSSIQQSYVANNFSTSLLMRATYNRFVPVRIVGLPFPGLSQSEFASRVIDAMPSGFLNHAEYMLDPGGISGGGFRVVWNFEPDPRASADDICEGHTRPGARLPTAAPQEAVKVAAALCQGPDAFVANFGAVTASSPDDPRFTTFVKDMTLATLLAPQDKR